MIPYERYHNQLLATEADAAEAARAFLNAHLPDRSLRRYRESNALMVTPRWARALRHTEGRNDTHISFINAPWRGTGWRFWRVTWYCLPWPDLLGFEVHVFGWGIGVMRCYGQRCYLCAGEPGALKHRWSTRLRGRGHVFTPGWPD